ncbi:MAG: hypothetical protein JWR33_256 [Naasia sp.]|jgi:hypothetical protein|uniref:hypothetical protein n=1 Tax=Naasia sp. TaxID=2546198 RepID=UPI002616DA2C|nr:hypothetical protein [Naasia sp.]MCU1569515.1 hypothetical protein [Naasia sp.]
MTDDTTRDERNLADNDGAQEKLRKEHDKELGLDPAFEGVDITESEGPDLVAGDDLDTGSGLGRSRG